MSDPGMVVLAGAGPGDPSLATLALVERLRWAEVVVYDYLANEELLRYAPQAKKICVGKRAGAHSWRQEDINALLLNLARRGRKVLRLKGGDPFVFGRGAEEALCLVQAGVPFEVVPGITSGTAALAYAGIPLTHRGLATTAVLATGQEQSGRSLQAGTLRRLAGLDGTLVFYMATAQVERICQSLIRYGRSPSTPAALIHRGTLPSQRVVVSTLAGLPADLRQAGVGAPGLLVVGEVVSLRRALNWMERRPLFGRRVAVTRSEEQGGQLASGLTALGAEVVLIPTVRIRALRVPRASLLSALSARWLVFSSVNGVDRFFEELRRVGRDLRSLSQIRIAAVGRATAGHLEHRFGLKADLVPRSFSSEALAGALLRREGRRLRGARVVLARAREGRDVLPRVLRNAGARVRLLPLYETAPDLGAARELNRALLERRLDWATFASSSAVRHFVALLSRPALDAARERLKVFCIGPITAQTAREERLQVALVSPQATIPDFLKAIEAYGRGSSTG